MNQTPNLVHKKQKKKIRKKSSKKKFEMLSLEKSKTNCSKFFLHSSTQVKVYLKENGVHEKKNV